MIHDTLPKGEEVEETAVGKKEERDGVHWRKFFLGRKGRQEQVPAVALRGAEFNGTFVVWVHPDGKSSLVRGGKLVAAARRILDRKAAILAVDVFRTGELQGAKRPDVDPRYAGYTFGYNRPLLAERVHDILTVVTFARGLPQTKAVHLVGFGKAGPWVVLARGLCGDAVTRTAADLNQFRFDRVTRAEDEMMLPGALKYGDLPALAALASPGELFLHNGFRYLRGAADRWRETWTADVYQADGAGKNLHESPERVDPAKVIDWLLR